MGMFWIFKRKPKPPPLWDALIEAMSWCGWIEVWISNPGSRQRWRNIRIMLAEILVDEKLKARGWDIK